MSMHPELGIAELKRLAPSISFSIQAQGVGEEEPRVLDASARPSEGGSNNDLLRQAHEEARLRRAQTQRDVKPQQQPGSLSLSRASTFSPQAAPASPSIK